MTIEAVRQYPSHTFRKLDSKESGQYNSIECEIITILFPLQQSTQEIVRCVRQACDDVDGFVKEIGERNLRARWSKR